MRVRPSYEFVFVKLLASEQAVSDIVIYSVHKIEQSQQNEIEPKAHTTRDT